MVIHGAALQKKEAFLFRVVDVGMELFAMAAVCSRVYALRQREHPAAEDAAELARLLPVLAVPQVLAHTRRRA